MQNHDSSSRRPLSLQFALHLVFLKSNKTLFQASASRPTLTLKSSTIMTLSLDGKACRTFLRYEEHYIIMKYIMRKYNEKTLKILLSQINTVVLQSFT